MTNREKKEVKEGKEDCPLSITDWVMFLSNEIDRTKRDQPPIMTALIAAILAIMGVGVTVAVMRIPESLYYHKLMFLFIISIFIVSFWILSFVISQWFKKKVESFENLRRRIILGKEKDCIKIRDEWRNIVSKKRFKFNLIILALVVFDLIALLATFILKYNIIFIKLLLLSITIAIVIPTIWYYLRVVKQPITSKEYYRTIVEEEYQYLDNNLLIKMLEMRIANRRNFIFAYLAFLATITLAIAFNLEKVRQYSHDLYFPVLCVLIGVIDIMVFVYYSFRLDRETIMELKELFKAMKRLDQLKKESDMDSVRHIEKSRTQQEEDSDEKDCSLSTMD